MPAQDVAPVENQVRFVELPAKIVVGSALMVTVITPVTVTVAEAVVDAETPLQVTV